MRTIPRNRLRFERAVTRLAYANLALAVLLVVVETFVAERTHLTTLIVLMPQAPFAVPTVALAAVALAGRMRTAAAVSLLAGAALLFGPLGFTVPLPREMPRESTKLRVMTYNVHQGRYGITEVAAVIDRCSPDVLCLQEVNANGPWGDPVWQIEQLQWKRWHVVREADVAILSRKPIRGRRSAYLPLGTMRAVLAAQILVNGKPVTVVTTHFNVARAGPSFLESRGRAREYLTSAASVRLAQTAALLKFAESLSGRVIITGDLNTPPRGFCYRRISSRYSDCFATAGWGFGYTYRSRLPVLRIDYVFADRSLAAASCFAPNAAASDHKPVVADILIPR